MMSSGTDNTNKILWCSPHLPLVRGQGHGHSPYQKYFWAVQRAKSVEHRVLADVFCFFGLENRKTRNVLSRRFLYPFDVFSTHYTSLQSFRVATSFAPGRRESYARHPRGDPAFAPDSLLPFAPDSTTLHSLRFVSFAPKSLGIQKSLSRTSVFLFSRPKKKKVSKNS